MLPKDAMQSDDDDDNDTQDDVAKVDATFEHPEHIVTVTTVCDVDLSGGSTTIGVNKVKLNKIYPFLEFYILVQYTYLLQ